MKRTVLIATALAAVLAVAAPAGGAKGGPPLELKATKQVELRGPKGPGEAPATLVTETSDAVAVTDVASVGEDASLVGSNGQTLGEALRVATATTYYREWSQRMESLLWGIAWNETHRGGYYFNGSTVWLKSRYSWDTSGYHRCGYGSGFGFTITVISCWKTGDPSGTGSRMVNGDHFRVSAIYNGFPISATHEMRACMYPSGSIVGC